MTKSLFLKTIGALMITIAMIALVTVVRFFIYQKVTSLENLANDLATKKQQEVSLVNIQQQYKQTAVAREKLSSFTLSSDQTVLLIESLESIAKQSEVSMTLEHVGGDAGTVFILKGSGSFSAIYQLVSLIETMPYPVFIEAGTMSVSTYNPRKPVWTTNLTLRFIVQPVASSTSNQIN